jgi:hypothetical protein
VVFDRAYPVLVKRPAFSLRRPPSSPAPNTQLGSSTQKQGALATAMPQAQALPAG